MLKFKRTDWGQVEEEDICKTGVAATEEIDCLYEETFKTFEEGSILEGTVISVGADGVVVDVGYKSEAVIPNEEFTKEALAAIQIGEKMPFFLEGLEDTDGNILLSKEKADKIKVWQEIEDIYRKDGIIEGKILSQIKGGLVVDIGVKAFLPGSQIDFRPIRDLDSLVGKTYPLKIVKMSPRRGNIVVSRRALLERTRDQKRSTALSTLKEGQIVDGVVKNITDYGAFVDLGGIDGLLHITDIAWGRVGHPSERFKVGEKLPVVVLKYDKDTSRISLGLKQMVPDPWTTVEVRYPIGSKAAGKVMSLADYGVFIEVEPGVEGLVHVSEISWTRDLKHPSKFVSVGDTVSFIILNIDKKGRKLALGMKQAEANPWDQVDQKYFAGDKISGKIKSITDFGVFVGMEETIDGLIHISDISWTRHLKHPSEVFKKGQEIEAVILKVDREKERISLGYKQITPDPWNEVPKKYPVGACVKGTVSKYADFGFFVDLQEGILGLVRLSETGVESAESTMKRYPIGSELSVRVLRLDTTERKIALSLFEMS
ncbi:MAG: 30S ribosomal protein S1 [Nitrospirae bacterium]|nr:30S ribosomal protein S1 [Candidatus Troglogloeales bacterium]MBI3599001.1 30S ribosomal protein S1 [Candidatus Troglogloeales bacterium]